MLIHWFVPLQVACVKSHHARPKVERDATLHMQQEVIQTDRSICLRNILFVFDIICSFYYIPFP